MTTTDAAVDCVYSVRDDRGCVSVYLNRPAKRNALDVRMLQSLEEAVASAEVGAGVRVLVLRSSSHDFSAGADLNEWVHPDAATAFAQSHLGSRVVQRLSRLSVPTVAVLEGATIGGGLEVALACDFRLGTPKLSAGFPEAQLGNLPSWSGITNLRRVVGDARARALLLTGELCDGREAARLGILTQLVEEDRLEQAVADLTVRLVACDATAMSLIKWTLDPASESSVRDAALAAYTAGLESSVSRKQAFLDQRRRGRQRSRDIRGGAA